VTKIEQQQGFDQRGQTLVLFLGIMRDLTPVIRLFFYHFYNTFAWTYDFVAAAVSIGRWNDWIGTILPFAQGRHVLEIGHGPGHLQRILQDPARFIVGLDESPQMGRLAKGRLERSGRASINLTRGLAQNLPFSAMSFDTVLSTFPAEFIFDERTLSDVYRVLRNGGRFVVLPAAWIVGRGALDRLAAWLFRVTGETPRNIIEIISERAIHPLEQAGFHVETQQIELKASIVLIVIARK
jgi:ubiquinone/menaquinone biosynthesis C-methylase UbiE